MSKDTKLIVESYKSTLIIGDKVSQTFIEGAVSEKAKKRAELIRQKLDDGFLRDLITNLKQNKKSMNEVTVEQFNLINKLVNAVTSEVGRAIIGLSVLQCTIKAICPEQSIRLHKGGSAKGKFSWTEGVSMRTIDTSFITPTLREFNLLKLNAHGFMMTRTLAENYPYSQVYKAAIKGAKTQWLELVELLESQKINARVALELIISLLINKSEIFESIAGDCSALTNNFLSKQTNIENYLNVFRELIFNVDYNARVFEIVLHSGFQSLSELRLIDGYLSPLSQMRSANKKHKNIADIEILHSKNADLIEWAFDAKFGKTDLREELEELSEKLASHPDCVVAGFICSSQPFITKKMKDRIIDIEDLHGLEISIYSFEDWVKSIFNIIPNKKMHIEFVKLWLNCLSNSLCQKRRHIAPIDEPCEEWVKSLIEILK